MDQKIKDWWLSLPINEMIENLVPLKISLFDGPDLTDQNIIDAYNLKYGTSL